MLKLKGKNSFEQQSVPAKYPTECSILLRIKVFCCNDDGKMCHLEIRH